MPRYAIKGHMVKSQFKQLEELIPNDVVSDGGEIDILVGADYYWSLVTEDIIRLNKKLVAIRSKLGYIMSGPVESGENRTTYSHNANCIHVMKVATDPLISIEKVKALDKKVEKFWSLDSIGIIPNEISVYDRTEQKIEFIEGRYQVELPFKEEFPTIGDNYEHCVRRLKSLRRKFEKTPALLERYDEIIRKQLRDGVIEEVQ